MLAIGSVRFCTRLAATLTIGAVLVASSSPAQGTYVVGLRFEVTDTGGVPVWEVSLAETFELRVFVQDLRGLTVPDRGVGMAFLDVFYDPPLVSIAGRVTFGPEYAALPDQSDRSTPGEIQNIGNALTDFGFGGPPGPSEFLLFLVPFQADTVGTGGFLGAPADNSPLTDVLIWPSFFAVPPENIAYGFASVSIVPEPSTFVLAALALLGLAFYASRRKR